MSEYDDSHMLSKILERMAAQSLHLKDKIDSGLEIPSWAEYKLYNAYSGLGSALGTAYPGTYGEEKMAAFSEALDRHPALKGKQSQLPDKIQAGIIKKKLRMRKQAGILVGGGGMLIAPEGSPVQLDTGYSKLLGVVPLPRAGVRIGDENSGVTLGNDFLGIDGGIRRGPAVYRHGKSRPIDSRDVKNALMGAAVGGLAGGSLVGLLPRSRFRKPLAVAAALAGAVPGAGIGASLGSGLEKESASTESQLLQALSAEGGAAGMKALRKRVKEDDLEQALKALISSGKVRRHPDGDLIKESAATATKTDPAKWEAAKREAKAKMGGKHSARAMQLATQIYKKKGGGYSGAKPTSQNNSLKKWGKQKWQWSGGDKPGQGGRGVYLPKKKQDRLKDSKAGRKLLARAAKKKSEATREGRQYSSHGLAAGTSLRSKK